MYGPDSNGIYPKIEGGYAQDDIKIPGVVYDDPKSGYHAGLYKRTINGKTEYVFATRGSEFTWKDWKNNIIQPLGLSSQYLINAKNALALQKYFGSTTDITFVGHSKGGGLAAESAMITDHPAITFNAAGLSPITKFEISNSLGNFVKNLYSPTFRKIDAYVVSGEVVSIAQGNFGLKADGNIHKVSVSWFSLYKYDPTGISRHLMGAMFNAMKNEGIK